MLLDAWMSDAVACCEKSGVTPPANLFSETPVVAESLSTPTMTQPPCPFAEVSVDEKISKNNGSLMKMRNELSD